MNNFRKVIALSVMVIMVISIAPVGVFAEDAPTVYWNKDIANLTDEFLGYGDGNEAGIEAKELIFERAGEADPAMTGTASFSGDIVIDDISSYGDTPGNIPSDETRTGTAIKLTASPSNAVKPEVALDFTDSAYTGIVRIDFDILFKTKLENFRIDITGDKGSTYIYWHGSYDLYSTPNIALNSSNQSYQSAGRTERTWYKWSIILDMEKGTMKLVKNGTVLSNSGREEGPTVYTGASGKLQKILFSRTNEADETFVCLDNISVYSHKEGPVFIDAEGNPAPTTGILPTRELNVKFDTLALFNDAVIGNSNNPFVVKKVSDDSTINVHTVTPVGTENCQWKLFLDSKLDDDTEYKLVAENVEDSAGTTATVEYKFKTTPPPANFGIYKMGYLDGGDGPKYEFNNGDTIKANLVVTNTSNAAEDVTGAVVIYKKTPNGIEMIGITADHENIAGEGGTANFTPNLSVTITDGDTTNTEGYIAKTFAWKGDLTTQTGAKFIPFDTASYKENKEN